MTGDHVRNECSAFTLYAESSMDADSNQIILVGRVEVFHNVLIDAELFGSLQGFLELLVFSTFASLSSFSLLVFTGQLVEVLLSRGHAGLALSSISFAFFHEMHEGVEGLPTIFLGIALSSAMFDELSLGGRLLFGRLRSGVTSLVGSF